MTLLSEIKLFFINENVINYVIAAIFGNTFYPIIMSIVKDIIIPILSALFYKLNSEKLNFTIRGVKIIYGTVIQNLIIFIISMIVIFFIFIKPYKEIMNNKKEKKRIEYKKELQNSKEAVKSIHDIEKLIRERSFPYPS